MARRAIIAAGFMLCAFAASAAAQQADTPLIQLADGFASDPNITTVRAGGDIAASEVDPSCRGYLADSPDLAIRYTAGARPLIISASSTADTMLVVRPPDGQFRCDDDGGVTGLNPAIRFEAPASGDYLVWVAAYRANMDIGARIYVSNSSSQ